uniref:Late blight resistance protein Rpi-blb2 n=1 Tax=Solanum tuberosum TaxID=4113 RepID=M1BV04_SOLTU
MFKKALYSYVRCWLKIGENDGGLVGEGEEDNKKEAGFQKQICRLNFEIPDASRVKREEETQRHRRDLHEKRRSASVKGERGLTLWPFLEEKDARSEKRKTSSNSKTLRLKSKMSGFENLIGVQHLVFWQVSFSALRKDLVNVVDIMERLKNEENQIALEDGVIELLKFRLALICAHFLLSYSDLEQFENVMTSLREPLKDVFQSILVNVDNSVGCKYNMPQVLGSLMDNIDDCITSCPRSTSMTEEELDSNT